MLQRLWLIQARGTESADKEYLRAQCLRTRE